MTRNTEPGALTRPIPGAMTPFNPFEEMNALRRQMDDLFSRAFGYTPLSQLIPMDGFNFEPPFEVKNLEDKVQLFAAVPGFKPEEIQVEATGESVQITGERKALAPPVPEAEKSWLTGESRFSIFCMLPAEVVPNKCKATVHDGMLTLELPKTEQAKVKTVKVNVTEK